ncbi:hypothetical protein QQZ08_003784 [Neonectria magnoliae]|uniref:Uncharacterized protein n=1 Tax=Neonectria magnoliae TaxID=2732573 RepID=A0ABR1I827_9HYPO
MTTSSRIDLDRTTAVVEWQWNRVTGSLATPDPSNTSIQLTIRLEPTRLRTMYALFEILVPVKLKDVPGSSAIYLRICPLSVTSFAFSPSTTASEAMEPRFDSAALCLDFRLNKNPTVLIPSSVREPVVAARDAILSKDELQSISNGVNQGHLKPFLNPDHDISRMYGGNGAKITTLPDPKPPPYTEDEPPPPPNAPAYDRKRARQSTDDERDSISQIWAELRTIHKRDAMRTTAFEAVQQETRELRADNATLREKLTALGKSHQDLEAEVAELKSAMMAMGDMKDAEKIEMQDDIMALINRVDYLDRGKDDDAFLERVTQDVLHELGTRLLGD